MENRRDLQPTLIVDRNGKTTTVYKSPTPSQSPNGAMPRPALSTNRKPLQEALGELQGHLVTTGATANTRRLINEANSVDPELIQTLRRLYATTNSYGTERLTAKLDGMLSKQIFTVISEDNPSEDVLRDLEVHMLATWHVNKLAREVPIEVAEIELATAHKHQILQSVDTYREQLPTELEDDYWRGLTVFCALQRPIAEYEADRILAFISWSAHQPDVQSVVALAKARYTIDIKLLEDLMSQTSTTALQEGTL